MSAYPWSTLEVNTLISCWEDNDILYDVLSKDYKNASKKEKVKRTIAETMKRNLEDVKGKMRNLRSQYMAETRKINSSKKSGAGTDDIYTSKWKLFSALQFLAKSNPVKDSQSNLIYGRDIEDDSSSNLMELPSFPAHLETEEVVIVEFPSELLNASGTSEPYCESEPSTSFQSTMQSRPDVLQPTSSKTLKQPTPSRSQKRDTAENDLLKESAQCLKKIAEKRKREEDDCDTFGRYIANEVRELSVPLRQVAKHRFQKILFELQTIQNPDLDQYGHLV